MIEYLGIKQFAELHGIEEATARRYKHDGRLPPPDAVIGTGPRAHHGWLRETAEAWKRPGQGARTDLQND
ncbi:hypothetical protein [Nocardia sp. NPDC046763]|uniref:hypothetical protein n=1 Tax=Nocardia sp. NPDC046763 TaxID=3155256 RepID=UPI0033E6614E